MDKVVVARKSVDRLVSAHYKFVYVMLDMRVHDAFPCFLSSVERRLDHDATQFLRADVDWETLVKERLRHEMLVKYYKEFDSSRSAAEEYERALWDAARDWCWDPRVLYLEHQRVFVGLVASQTGSGSLLPLLFVTKGTGPVALARLLLTRGIPEIPFATDGSSEEDHPDWHTDRHVSKYRHRAGEEEGAPAKRTRVEQTGP